MSTHLLLAHADDHTPFIDEGVSSNAPFTPPHIEMDFPSTTKIAKFDSLPNALPEQRWALVVPKGEIGDRLLSLIQPLRERREEEQGENAFVYRVDPKMNAVQSVAWIQREYRDPAKHDEATRPRYLALLGGPELISWDLQQMLAGEAFVGRIGFDDEDDYAAYAEKAKRHSENENSPLARAIFHCVHDRTKATTEGHRRLLQPSLEYARKHHNHSIFDAESILETSANTTGVSLEPAAAADELLRQTAAEQASFLFTISHGAGLPKSGWKSRDEQRALQGAMVLRGTGDLFTANDVRNGPFLPGGIWFMFACYGAGTPTRSAYYPWLHDLENLGSYAAAAKEVLRALPCEDENPFIAALPQAALANPDGPIGIVGHVDLAWAWSFLDYDPSKTGWTAKCRADRFQSLLRGFVNGHRFGVAHHELVKYSREIDKVLTTWDEHAKQNALVKTDSSEHIDLMERRANLWMQRQDLNAYVLLGDPAARLPITRFLPGVHEKRCAARILIDNDELARRERTVMAILRKTTTPQNGAIQHGVSPDEVERWVRIFMDAGRAALAKTS